MYQVTSNYLDAIKQPSRRFKSTVQIYDTTFTDTDVIQIDYEENSNPAESFEIGSVNASKIEVTFANSTVLGALVLDGAPVKPIISLYVNSAFEGVPLGTFFVDSIDKGKNTTKIVCYDSMMKMEQAYFSDLTYPASISAVVNEICTKAKIECVTTLPTNLNITKMEGCTHRQAISYIASFLGDFARFNRAGKLEFVSYTDSGFSIGPQNYITFKCTGKNFTVGRMACQCPDGTILNEGTNGNEIQLTSTIMTQTQLDSIFAILKNIEYMPYSCEWQGNPALQSGDKITITDTSGASYTTLVMSSKFTYKGGLTGAISAIGKSDAAQEFSPAGSITQTVQKVVVEQANVEKLLANCATVENLKATNARIDNISIGTANIQDLAVDTAKIYNLAVTNEKIADAAIDTAKIKDASITNAKIVDATITGAKIGLGEIDHARIADDAIGTANIQDASITTAKIGLAQVQTAQIQDASIIEAKIADAAITNAKIGKAAVMEANISDAAITEAKIKDASISTAKIQNAAITTACIAQGAITTALISKGAIGEVQIADASITSAKIVSVDAATINVGTLSVERLCIVGSNKSIVYSINEANGTAQLSQSTIDGGALTQRSITSDLIVAHSITANEIAAHSITANEILANSITGAEIKANSITAENLAVGAVTADAITAGILKSAKSGWTFDLDKGTFNLAGKMWFDGTNFDWATGVMKWDCLDSESQENLSSWDVKITSTNGSAYHHGQKWSTVLDAHLFCGKSDITAERDAIGFTWTRTSSDSDADTIWNENNGHGKKSIIVTQDDIIDRATTFNCTYADYIAPIPPSSTANSTAMLN